MRIKWYAGPSLLCALAAGCAPRHGMSPYTAPEEIRREPARAEELNRRAAGLLDADPEAAEQMLREALAADLFSGPAHNNLGLLYLAQGRLYEAAGEFEWAKRLLPGHPDPRLNLGLTLERAGRDDQAEAAFRTALEVWPEHAPTMQALARLRVRRGVVDEETIGLLREVAMRGETDEWRSWARLEVLRRADR